MFSLTYDLRIDKVVARWPSSSSSSPPVVAALIRTSENENKTTVFVCKAGPSDDTATIDDKESGYGGMS